MCGTDSNASFLVDQWRRARIPEGDEVTEGKYPGPDSGEPCDQAVEQRPDYKDITRKG